MAGAPEEAVGDAFDVKRLLAARDRTRACVEAIAARVEVGMTEPTVRALADELLKAEGATKGWHRTVVRIGPDTTRAFKELSDPEIALRPSDIFFIDVGPVFDGHEGDFGRTFVVGDDPELRRCADDAERVFEAVRARWRQTGEGGPRLYDFAQESARVRGWELNLGQGQGHRVSEFPHAYHHRGKLAHYPARPSADRWILEIALRHPTEPYGSFFEDLLR